MSDALSKFISGLQSLDPTNLNAPANQAAMQKFQSLPNAEQRDVLNGLAGAYGATFDELNGLSEADKRRVTDNLKNGRGTFDGVNRQQQPAQQPERPPSFEQAWTKSQDAERSDPAGLQAYAKSHEGFAAQHGAEAARTRHGYQTPSRQAQLERIADMQREAKATNKSFSEVADARIASGR